MKKILVATVKPFHPEAVENIKEKAANQGYEFQLLEKYGDQSELIDAVKDADALIIRSDKVTREVIEAGKNLKIVVRGGAGYDNVDLEAASEKGVVVMNTPGQNSNAVAELALGMMVYHARNHFNGKAGTELRGKTLGIHAYGNVGKLVAEIARGFGMAVYAFDPFIDKSIIEKDGVEALNTAEELYSTCQYISLHIPANEKTKRSINFDMLNKMPKGATLVNTARKEVIDEEGLKKVFAERDDFHYITDIAPDCKEEIAGKYDGRYFWTPKKMGAQTSEANINAGIAAINQIIGYFEKGDNTFQVNK
ncbi:MAG: 3-phosphoglycerate dehydrogenase [Bacteroidales bacterium]|nr:3-phosphoglycerate dehydrogenase [Bacteroidales bacterium]